MIRDNCTIFQSQRSNGIMPISFRSQSMKKFSVLLTHFNGSYSAPPFPIQKLKVQKMLQMQLDQIMKVELMPVKRLNSSKQSKMSTTLLHLAIKDFIFETFMCQLLRSLLKDLNLSAILAVMWVLLEVED